MRKAVLAEMGLDLDVNAYCRDLNAAEQQMVEIAKVVAKNAKVVILDEPTHLFLKKKLIPCLYRLKK